MQQREDPIVAQAREVLKIEAQGILDLLDRIGEAFRRAVEAILVSKGRVIVTGMGKSGLVGRKIAATFNSTGTLAFFLHPAEAIHGDLGMVSAEDVVLALSNSGRTQEINRILPLLKNMGTLIIGLTGDLESPMALQCDILLDVGVEREACPMGLAPTASTTAALAMGDAMAVALIHCRRFSIRDFQRFHPGGNLGERLTAKVRDVMRTGERIPMVQDETPLIAAVKEMSAKGMGATLVVTPDSRLLGIATDGDLRRALLKGLGIEKACVRDLMSVSPLTIDEGQSALDALNIMEYHRITHLAILDRERKVKGIVHLHDLLSRETPRDRD